MRKAMRLVRMMRLILLDSNLESFFVIFILRAPLLPPSADPSDGFIFLHPIELAPPKFLPLTLSPIVKIFNPPLPFINFFFFSLSFGSFRTPFTTAPSKTFSDRDDLSSRFYFSGHTSPSCTFMTRLERFLNVFLISHPFPFQFQDLFTRFFSFIVLSQKKTPLYNILKITNKTKERPPSVGSFENLNRSFLSMNVCRSRVYILIFFLQRSWRIKGDAYRVCLRTLSVTAQTQVPWLGCPTMNPFSLDPPNRGWADVEEDESLLAPAGSSCSSIVLLGSVAVNLTVVAPKGFSFEHIKIDQRIN